LPPLTLILGGARSGKSELAERLAAQSGGRVVFLATAVAGDAEMTERIARHRASRPREWITVEEPIDLAGAVGRTCRPGDFLVVDCLTLWLSNWLISRAGETPDDLSVAQVAGLEEEALAIVGAALDAVQASGAAAVIVSNEVGLGIVPPYPLGRLYRDLLGRLNRAVAMRADRVLLLVAGLPIDLRGLVPPELRSLLASPSLGET
jgi:adenosylcobinamide kinase/adenosylcobinamide-phosphate guanylyltransferase